MSHTTDKLKIGYLAAALVLLSLPLAAQQQEVVVPGKVVTGFNQYLGQPFVDYGPPLFTLGFSAVAEHDPDGGTPLSLTPDTPGSAVLATTLDPVFLAFLGIDFSTLDPTIVNVPLRGVPTGVDLADVLREPLPGSEDVPFFVASQAGPSRPIDLDTWNRARGFVSFQCGDRGKSQIVVAGRNLLPNRVYSVWANYLTAQGLAVVPFGGVPNAFVTDENGYGSLRRTLTGCPLDLPAPGDPILISLELMYHSDHMINGTVPALSFKGGLGLGVITHPHLGFNVLGQELLEPEGWGDGDCLPGSRNLCLNDGRFRVEIEWTDFQGQSGAGRTVDFASNDSGELYFFQRDNQEVLVKVLNSCSINDRFWVFASAATNLAYNLTVTDTLTQETRTYTNELGRLAPAIADTGAFASCQ